MKAQIVYVASYSDSMYPEDDKILGVFSSKEKAENAIEQSIEYHKDPKYPQLHLARRYYYDITECELDSDEINFY